MEKKAASATWDNIIKGCLKSKQNPDKSWLTNVTEDAAILNHKGVVQASTNPKLFTAYEHEMMTEEGKKKISVNEGAILSEMVLTGKTSCPAGIRIGGIKYMLVSYDKDKKLAYFSKIQGGAAAMATKNVIVFASYSVKLIASDKQAQNPGLCNEVVEKTAKMLIEKEGGK